MRSAVMSYIAATVVLFGLDFIWLSTSVPLLYRPRVGHLLLETPNMPAAAGFYLLYVVGVVALCILPALQQASWGRAVWSGALLGLVAYGTYDMTNLATLIGWSAVVSVVDMLWGAVVTAAAAAAGYFVTRALG